MLTILGIDFKTAILKMLEELTETMSKELKHNNIQI